MTASFAPTRDAQRTAPQSRRDLNAGRRNERRGVATEVVEDYRDVALHPGYRESGYHEPGYREPGYRDSRSRISTAPAAPGRRLPRNPVRRIVPKPEGGRLGSRQVVSVRGRRTVQTKKVSRVMRISAVSFVLLLVGVVVAMTLSGMSTQQTFELQNLKSQENQLDNQLETLKRDLEVQRSAAHLAQQATDRGMVVPQQPGILAVAPDGQVEEARPAGEESTALLNINDSSDKGHRASRNPDKTKELGNNLVPVPQGQARVPAAGQRPAAPAAGAPSGVPAPAAPGGAGAVPPPYIG